MKTIDVKLQVFEGPLDLLLHLVEKNKIDIYDIPIVTITQQYISYMEKMKEHNVEMTSEFLVIAASLIEIKSKMLLPKEKKEEAEDPREELVNKLLEYKMYRYVSELLKENQKEALKIFYGLERMPDSIEENEKINTEEIVGDTTANKLCHVFQKVIEQKKKSWKNTQDLKKQIEKKEINIDEKRKKLMITLKQKKKMELFDLLWIEETKQDMIAAFLSVLESMKIGEIMLRQKGETLWVYYMNNI